MKHLYILAFAIGILPAQGQLLTALEIINKTKCTDFECFNSLITKKGFSYYNNEEEDGINIGRYAGEAYHFKSDNTVNDLENGSKINNTAYFYYNVDTLPEYYSLTTEVGFMTTAKTTYQQLLNQFIALGFKADTSYKNRNGMETRYHATNYKEGYLFVNTLFVKDIQTSKAWTSYNIGFQKKKTIVAAEKIKAEAMLTYFAYDTIILNKKFDIEGFKFDNDIIEGRETKIMYSSTHYDGLSCRQNYITLVFNHKYNCVTALTQSVTGQNTFNNLLEQFNELGFINFGGNNYGGYNYETDRYPHISLTTELKSEDNAAGKQIEYYRITLSRK